MNCNDIERILDDGDLETLGAHERAAAAAHRETCRDCALEWTVHERLVTAPAPVMPGALLARCKASFVAAAVTNGRSRSRARPFVLIGLFFGAAAAALVGTQLVEVGAERGGGDASAAATAATAAARDASKLDAPQALDDAEPPVDAGSADAQAASPAAARPDPATTSSPDSFVLAVSTLQQENLDAAARAIVESMYAELLRQLRAIPNITVVETQFEQRGEPISVIYSEGAVARGGSSATVSIAGVRTVDPPGTAANDGPGGTAYGVRTLTLLDRRGATSSTGTDGTEPTLDAGGVEPIADAGSAVPIPGTGGAEPIPDAGGIDPNFVPAALRARIAAVSGGAPATYGADATAGVVNVLLDNNSNNSSWTVEYGPTFTGDGDSSAGTDVRYAADAETRDLTRAFDYRLDIEATAVVADGAESQWIVTVRGSGNDQPGSRSFNFTASGNSSQAVDARVTAARIVESVRRSALPADGQLLDSLQTRVLDSRLTTDERLQALDELQQIQGRTGIDGRNDNVARAVAELASPATRPFVRQRLWQLVRGAKNEELVRPLLDAFLYDSNEEARLEAARTLAADFIDHSSVRAAFEQAAYTDDSAAIRLEASWAVRDASARKSYIRDTLLNTSLSADERIAPLLFAMNENVVAQARRYADATAEGEQPIISVTSDYTDVIDDSAAQALVEILRRMDDQPSKRSVVMQLARITHPALTSFNLDVLRGDADERMRASAATALGARLDEPGVRAGLENARTLDTSPRVRDAAARSLSAR